MMTQKRRTRSSVNTLIVFPPQFWTSVRGITSIASATALKGPFSTPVIVFAYHHRVSFSLSIIIAPTAGWYKTGRCRRVRRASKKKHTLACNPTLIAISVAPPPGAKSGLNTTFLATDMASARFRSISFKMSFEGPRRKMVHAFGVLHSVRKVKYLFVGGWVSVGRTCHRER
jgi:hypothetical protein